jgi:hypothetical protein
MSKEGRKPLMQFVTKITAGNRHAETVTGRECGKEKVEW